MSVHAQATYILSEFRKNRSCENLYICENEYEKFFVRCSGDDKCLAQNLEIISVTES